MNFYMISFLIIVLPYAFISIYQDMKSRKVSNWVNLSFLYLSFLVFVFFLTKFSVWDFVFVFLSILLSLLLFYKKVWGGADGKNFMALSLIVISFGDYIFFLDFLINLVVLYSVIMILIVLFKISLSDKKSVFNNIDLGFLFFEVVFVFLVLKFLVLGFLDPTTAFFSYLIILIYGIYIFASKYIKRLYYFIALDYRFFVNIVFFLFFLYFAGEVMLIYFFAVLFLRFLVRFISKSSEKLKDYEGRKYYSPFSLYLFLGAILTIVSETNIFEFLLWIF